MREGSIVPQDGGGPGVRQTARWWVGVGGAVTLLAAVLAGSVSAQTPVRVYYDDDFILETADGAFQLRLRGNLHLDTRLYRGDGQAAISNLDIRRARIDFVGRIHERFTFRIQPELSGSPYLRNAWADWEVADWLHLRWGQMKVPFSSSWLTQDNNLNFVERGTAGPVHPFFDRGFLLRGELFGGVATYDLGVFTGAGTDADVSAGDIDSEKEVAARLFLRPSPGDAAALLHGLTMVVGGTWTGATVPTARYESRGLRGADHGAALWRWQTDQVLGTDGRVTDRVGATIGSRRRLGIEAHWLRGPFVVSSELVELRYDDVSAHHELWRGSTLLERVPVARRSGAIRSWSTWASWYVTGEAKRLTDGGWRTARPATVWGSGATGRRGSGAVELLARYSRTVSDYALFHPWTVAGFSPGSTAGLPPDYDGALPGSGVRLTAAVLDGAHTVNEITLGVNWNVNSMVRVQLNDVLLWAPPEDRTGDGVNDNLLISGGFTAAAPERRGWRTRWQNAVLLRLVLKI